MRSSRPAKASFDPSSQTGPRPVRCESGGDETMKIRYCVAALASAALLAAAPAQAQDKKLKVGFMLPYTGTYAALGIAIENGFRLYVDEQGGKLGGRDIEYVKVDDESDPSKAT